MERADRRGGRARGLIRAAALLVLPLLFVGPSLLTGRRLLPQHPAGFAPLSLEDPGRAGRAWEGANYWTSDALFPFTTDALALGRSAFAEWDPTLGLGSPIPGGNFLATYPPNLLHLVAPDAAAFGWLALASLFLAGLGTYCLLRERGASAPARLVGALAQQAGGFGLLHLHHGMQVAAALWLPWCLFAVERMAAPSRGGRASGGLVLFGATALSFLAGFPPIAIFVAITTLVYALVRARVAGPALPARALGWVALGVLAAAPALLPVFQASRYTLREPASAESLEAQTLPRAALTTTFVPGLFGLPTDPFFAPNHPLAWWLTSREEVDAAQTASPLEWNAHAGVAVLLLALAALLGRPRRAAPLAAGLFCVFGFAFGWPPFHGLLRVPGLDLGAPGRVLAIAWCLWPLLAAHGFEALVERRRMSLAVLVIVALGAATLGAGLWRGIEPETLAANMEQRLAERHGVPMEDVVRRIPREHGVRAAQRLKSEGRALALFPLAALACAWITFLASRSDRRRGMWVALPWALLIGGEGLRIAHTSLVPRAVPGALFPDSEGIDAVREAAGGGRVLRLDESPSGVAEVERLARPNLLSAYGVHDLLPYVVFPDAAVVEVLERFDPASRYRSGASRISRVQSIGHTALDVMRVTCVLSLRALEHPRLELVHAREGFHVYRRSGARPEAEVFPSALAASRDLSLERLAAGAFDPARTLVLDRRMYDERKDALPLPQVGWIPGAVTVERPAPDRVEIDVRGTSGGWLVLYDGWYPGWRARVNGDRATVHRAQHLVRAVPVPAGDVHVSLRFRPVPLRLGAALTALALGIAFAVHRKAAVLRRKATVS